ncbi:hypothetical protein ONZ45_g16325 [Pleurotus djamor]|nr:hypothetical protein ONZ45_g16325 [Pleurotus djamor]
MSSSSVLASPHGLGGALSDVTNASIRPAKLKQRNDPKASQLGFPLPSSATRKSLPTCTLSLAFASSCNSNAANSSQHEISLVPFPSSVPFPSDPQTYSESDVDSLDSSASRPLQTRRRRSNACLAQTLKSRSSSTSPAIRPRSSSSTSRKRAKKVTKRLNADLQFLSLLQRSVAWKLAERGVGVSEPCDGVMALGFEVQDVALVGRLRSYLIAQGCGSASLQPEADEQFAMDLDVPADFLPPSAQSKVAPMSALVASLILRHRERSALRARSTRQLDACKPSRVTSPLALCVRVEC